ncbi:hypothetical protein RHMOL_Rhmol11G0124600 [Rhododendron molle]|uniref:Uncharacterized protein n=2 Tax=Rhododendron molle TaxID=49168 RepID=A0ACC0LT34_RHOML|nr:hypothetical protein RHMOL_Rhmol11G0124600 [Rhododendron molle]KAI8531284.1 hypothetical protein RHMOL_Rhmol11G0124600 [Rhododendron molle]
MGSWSTHKGAHSYAFLVSFPIPLAGGERAGQSPEPSRKKTRNRKHVELSRKNFVDHLYAALFDKVVVCIAEERTENVLLVVVVADGCGGGRSVAAVGVGGVG